MLTVYRRHRSACPHGSDRYYRRCKCACWCKGTVEGRGVQISLKTRSWERAVELARQLEEGHHETQHQTIEAALTSYLKDCEARGLNVSTLHKYSYLRDRLSDFSKECSYTRLHELTSDVLRKFREGRSLSPVTAGKELERLKAFLNFCVESGWLEKNPAKHIKAPHVRQKPTLPFSDKEVMGIFVQSRHREATFFKLLLYSGLRILDAATLRPERIVDGKLFLYQQKTGTPVWLPLPPDLIADLGRLKTTGGYYFAVQSEVPATIAEYYRVRLKIAAKKAGVLNAHPHRFRDTFSVNLLQKGVPLETVSILLGHSSIKITEKHYSPWVQTRQDMLEEAVRKTWKPKLVRVK